MAALITLARATELVPNFPSSDSSVMQDCINAASDVVVRYCNNPFVLQTYDELYDGTGDFNLLLNYYPVTQVLRIAFVEAQVLQIRMTDAGVARASFRVDGDGSQPPKPNALYLVSLKNGVETDININLQTGATTVNGVPGTTYPMLMLSDLATAINGFSSYGWSALALGTYASWPIADLRPPQGAFECRWFGNAYMTQHVWNQPFYSQNPDIGEVVSPMTFAYGYRNYRVIYQAGWATVPNPVQQAVAALAVSVYLNRGQNDNLAGENLGGYSYTQIAEKSFHQLDLAARYGLSLYKNHRAAKFKITA